jgi:plasmid stability protein
MPTLVIRNIETGLHARLKAVAAAHGRSMEEEARQVLRAALTSSAAPNTVGLGDAMRALFEPLGGLDLPEIDRGPAREPPDFCGPDWDPDRPA